MSLCAVYPSSIPTAANEIATFYNCYFLSRGELLIVAAGVGESPS